MNPSEINNMLLEAADDLRRAHRDLEERSRMSAKADAEWRESRAKAHARTEGTVDERNAAVERETARLRYTAKLAEDLRVSALEAVRSRRSILSAIQSVAATVRSEAELLRTGDYAP